MPDKKDWEAVDPRDGKMKDAKEVTWPPTRNQDRETVVDVTFEDGETFATPLEHTNYDG